MIELQRCNEKLQWDDFIVESNGHPLQLWSWGQVKADSGWKVERFFGVPGLALLTIKSINVKDTFVTLGAELLYSALFVSMMLLVDIAYGLVDPRIRLLGGSKND